MRVINSITVMRKLIEKVKKENKTIGFVPTMGYLHEGHLSLLRQAGIENDFLVLSIFVNPIQFGPSEDIYSYPRNFEGDKKLAQKEKVDCIFYPRQKDIYPKDYRTFVSVEELDSYLCGLYRPGHFKGAATVVAKLFNIVSPDTAYFGQKDIQQAVIIKKMAKDLNFPLKIKILPTIREKNGLALSSRNKYLSPKQKKDAGILYASLKKAENLIKSGEKDAGKIKGIMRGVINKKKTARLQYIEIVDMHGLKPVKKIKKKTIIAAACYFGRARLIDNLII